MRRGYITRVAWPHGVLVIFEASHGSRAAFNYDQHQRGAAGESSEVTTSSIVSGQGHDLEN